MKTLHCLFAGLLIGVAAPSALAQSSETPIQRADRISISIGAVPDNEVAQIKGVYTVSDNGTINLLHIGEVRAAGLKPSSLQRAIEQTYKDREIYTRPNVLVSMDNGDAQTSRQVFVTGAQKPGAVPYKPGMRLSQAIQFAGGPTAFANMKRVKLVRAGRAPTVHNMKSDMGNPAVDVILQPDDQINIPE